MKRRLEFVVFLAILLLVPSGYSRIDYAAGPIGSPTLTSRERSSTPVIDVMYATPSASPAPAGTPELPQSRADTSSHFLTGASLLKGDEVERYVWDDSAVDFASVGLKPVSFTIGNFDGSIYIYAEFVNVSGADLLTPFLKFDALYQGKSFGPQTVWSPQYIVSEGEPVFYTGHGVYGGSILYGDWTSFEVSFEAGVEWGEDLDTTSLRLDVDEKKLFNEGTQDRSSVTIQGIGRDSDGIYLGSCSDGQIGAAVPAELFVRVPESVSLSTGPARYCNQAASDFAQRLGTSPISITEFIIIVPRP